jgi:molecular chaperone GrpE
VSDLPAPSEDGGHEAPVIRDKRRFNPDGSARSADPSGSAAGPVSAPAPAVEPEVEAPALDPQVQELTDTLQRLKAEYDNYRRRTERERELVRDAATAQVLSGLLPILDDVERARVHGDLTGAFGAVGDALVTVVAKLGLESYGEPGEVFDPQVHDAVMTAAPQEGIDATVAAQVFRPGFRFAGRVLRPAQVAVAEPAPGGGEPAVEPAPEA